MKLLTPHQARGRGYKSITTDINPKCEVVKKAPRESFVRNLDSMLAGEISLDQHIAYLKNRTDSRYGVSESDIIQSMSETMRGVDAVWMVFSETRWQLARKAGEIRGYDDLPD